MMGLFFFVKKWGLTPLFDKSFGFVKQNLIIFLCISLGNAKHWGFNLKNFELLLLMCCQ
jgi:hypothetical protein